MSLTFLFFMLLENVSSDMPFFSIRKRWKHAAQCHKGSSIEEETDIHTEDDVSRTVLASEKASPLALSPGKREKERSGSSGVGSAGAGPSGEN